MTSMRRLIVLALAVVALTACSPGSPDPSPTASTPATASPTGPTAPPSASPTASPSPEPSPSPADVRLPEDAPFVVEDPAADASIATGDPTPLAPPGAEIDFQDVRTDPFDQVAFTWRRGDDPFAQEQGFAVWQRSGEAWRAVFAFTDRPSEGVLGISVQVGELTGDDAGEYVTFEQTGGSGACGTWRVIVPTPGAAEEAFHRATCDTDIRIVNGALEMRTSVFAPGDPHCCPSAFRTSRFEWDGEAFVRVSSQVIPAGG